MESRPNILLLMADQWRADCLGFDGHPIVKTPNLDELFLNGIHFRQSYAACPTCVPARMSLLTGLKPTSHRRVGYVDGVEFDVEETLPATLAKAGYHAHCVGKMHVSPVRSLCGFHSIDLHDGTISHNRLDSIDHNRIDDYQNWLRTREFPTSTVCDSGLWSNSWVAHPWPYHEMNHPSCWVAEKSIEFLHRRDPQKPFFLKASFVRPHPPFDPPASFLDLYEGEDLPPVSVGDWVDGEMKNKAKGLCHSFGRGKINTQQHHRARCAYYALQTHIDHQIGRILQKLLLLNELNNTLILFISDHGELLGDHHLWAKAMPFDGSARIPFIMSLPKNQERWKKLHCEVDNEHVVELRDIFPTICDIAGVEVPKTVEGESLMPLLNGENNYWREYLHGEHYFWEDSTQWLTDGVEKYIWFSQSGKELLFNIKNDPNELKNLTKQKPAKLEHWRQKLSHVLKNRPEGFVANGKLRVGAQQGPLLREPFKAGIN